MNDLLTKLRERRLERDKVQAMERLAGAMERKAEQTRVAAAPDKVLRDIQQAFDQLKRETGRTPSQRAVAKRSGYDRSTVRARWNHIEA